MATLRTSRLLWILLLIANLVLPSAANADLKDSEIITKFYELLTKDRALTGSEENDFFGTDEPFNQSIRDLIVRGNYRYDATPIWTYLRKHRDYFFGDSGIYLGPTSVSNLMISAPFKMMRNDKELATTTGWGSADEKKEADLWVLVIAPPYRKSNDTARNFILFGLGHKCYLDLAGTYIPRRGQMMSLYDVIKANK